MSVCLLVKERQGTSSLRDHGEEHEGRSMTSTYSQSEATTLPTAKQTKCGVEHWENAVFLFTASTYPHIICKRREHQKKVLIM
jgi:hypothetical protein